MHFLIEPANYQMKWEINYMYMDSPELLNGIGFNSRTLEHSTRVVIRITKAILIIYVNIITITPTTCTNTTTIIGTSIQYQQQHPNYNCVL
jgi:hypothetical protein